MDKLQEILDNAETNNSNCENWKVYEFYKKQITELNLTPDEYEYAVAKVAEIVGV